MVAAEIPEVKEIIALAKETRAAGLTPVECKQALPFAVICKRLNLKPERLVEFVEATIKMGEPEFPAHEYADAVARIHRREKETGLSIEEVATTHQNLTSEVQSLRSERATLQVSVKDLQDRSNAFTRELQTKQPQVAALDARLDSADVTLHQLNAYTEDKAYFAKNGLDIKNLPLVRNVFASFELLNYDPHAIIGSINNLGNLRTGLTKIIEEIKGLEKQKETLAREIDALKVQRKQNEDELTRTKPEIDKKIADIRVDADKKIAGINQHVTDEMNAAGVTLQELREFLAVRDGLRKAGMKL
jgi:chromosome segregation ATPase